MQTMWSRLWFGCLVAAVLAAGGLFAVVGDASGGAQSAAAPRDASGTARAAALPHRLGYVGSVSASVRWPIGRRLVIRPHATYVVKSAELRRVLRALATRHAVVPRSLSRRLTVTFRVRISSVPTHGKARTLVVRSRTLTRHALALSTAHSREGARFRVGRLVLSRAQTAKVKRAVRRHPALRIDSRVSYRVRFTTPRGRTVTLAGTPWHFAWIQRFTAPRTGGAKLDRLAGELRDVIGKVRTWRLSCVTRNALVRRLRITDSVLLSGRRSAAASLLGIWIADAKSMRGTGLLSREQQQTLRDSLRAIQRRVGTGRPVKLRPSRRWPALPRCGASSASAAQFQYQAFDAGDASIVARAIVSYIPVVGRFLDPLVGVLWPNPADDTTSVIQLAVDQGVYDVVGGALKGVQGLINDFSTIESKLGTLDYTPAKVAEEWGTHLTSIIGWLGQFTITTRAWSLLPLYAQYENLYLSYVREGVLAGKKWGWSPDIIKDKYYTYFLGGDGVVTRGTTGINDANKYVKDVRDAQIAADKGTATDPQQVFVNTNADQRKFQLMVGDYQPIWRFLDPFAYPYGDPNFRLTRMIYSDRIGATKGTFQLPLNVDYPLTHLSVWTSGQFEHSSPSTAVPYVHSLKADNAPLTGAVTGDTSTSHATESSYDVTPGTTRGPIIGVDAVDGQQGPGTQKLIKAMRLYFADDTSDVPGGQMIGSWDSELGPGKEAVPDFAYADETLATARAMGRYDWGGLYSADSAVFGFRFADSFPPSGLVQSVGIPGKCLDVPAGGDGTEAIIGTCGATASGSQDWTYNSSTHQLSTSRPATYTGTFTTGTAKCLAARDGGTTPGTAVWIVPCSMADAQGNETLYGTEWLVSSDGSIVNRPSWLCLQPGADNTRMQLSTCSDTSAAQRWTTPWTKRLPGMMRAPGTTQCMEVTDGSIEPNAPLQMMRCDKAPDAWPQRWQQEWNYDETTGVGGTRATFSLRVYAGNMCITPGEGPTFLKDARSSDCNASAAQKFTVGADGSFTNDQTGLCLERSTTRIFPNGTSTVVPVNSDGSAVQLHTCSATNAAQKWTWPEG